ncbi:hypothetical protein Syun_001688 [Stephania yunnanensis]|uniref:Telomerase reverse transcriptase n=1 Tax=Stephania yunnanensis TaxID=152371 RepID=A0AAP0LFA6_9MAGN
MDLLDKHCQVSAISSSAARELIALEDCCLFAKKLRGRSTASQVECCLKDGTTSGCSLELNGPYCSKHQVVSFVWAVCRSVIPVDLLGTPSNWRALRRNISKLIRLRKFEKFSVRQCIHGLETSCIPLLSRIHMFDCLRHHELRKGLLKGCTMCSESEATLRNRLFSCWIYWLFSRLVLPIVQANFYVTESEVGKLETFYYRRNIWERITSRALSSLKKQSYHLLDDKLLRNILRKRSFGYSKVRFCPKEHGVRAVASLSAPSKIYAQNHLKDQSTASKSSLRIVQGMEMFSCFKSVNYVLRDLNSVLKGIKMKHTEMLGSFVSDYNDVYKNLLPFFVNLKNRFATFPSVYMVVCDVSKAFDSVDQDQLLSVMKEIMVDDIYHVKQLLQVVCTKKSLWTRRNETSLDKNISSSSIGSKASFPFHSLHGILVNQEGSKMIRKEDLYHNLYEHVKNNVLRVGQNLYLQEVGIPQGSVISSLLCSFYYGHLERKVIFPFLEKVDNNHPSEPSKGSFSGNICNADAIKNGSKDDCSKLHFHSLLRFVDDYLFMSTSKKHASSFFLRLQRGFRGYNFSINKAKSCVNFDMDNVPAISLKKMYTGEDGVSFVPWSGLLINTCTLEIQADYTRYSNSIVDVGLWRGEDGGFIHVQE